MKVVEENKELKMKLLEKGYNNLMDYCKKNGLDYNRVRFILHGYLNGSRSKEVEKTRKKLLKDFGKEILKEV